MGVEGVTFKITDIPAQSIAVAGQLIGVARLTAHLRGDGVGFGHDSFSQTRTGRSLTAQIHLQPGDHVIGRGGDPAGGLHLGVRLGPHLEPARLSPGPDMVPALRLKIEIRGARAGVFQAQRIKNPLIQPVLPGPACDRLQDGAIQIVAQIIVIKARLARGHHRFDQPWIIGRIDARDIGFEDHDQIGADRNLMADQIAQGPVRRVHALGKAHIRPMIGQRRVKAENALRIQLRRQEPHKGLGLGRDIDRGVRSQRRTGARPALPPNLAQQNFIGRYGHHRVARTQILKPGQKVLHPLRCRFRGLRLREHHG